jgi:ornithine cyclodeaminase/alanine dehydrogenase-like protein (mu-crystallin family)
LVLVLSGRVVERLLDLDELVDAVAGAMADLSADRASMPPRGAAIVAQHDGMLAAMPAYLPSAQALTAKLVSVFPHNRDRTTHQAIICCFDAGTGTPIALMDGTYVTAMRTAACSALATRYLARTDARVLSIIGTGVQARAHARFLGRRTGIDTVLIAGRDPAKTTALADELAASGLAAAPAASIEAAVGGGDIVCATTHSDVPVVRRSWLRAGTHVNSVGYNSAGDGEVDGDVIRDAVLVVESRSAVLASPPAGAVEIRRAIDAGLVTADHIHAEIGELVSGQATGRTTPGEITLYKSVGVAVQDAAAAALVLAAATRTTTGTRVEL